MVNKVQGIIHGILPAFFLAISVGQIYAFTNFSTEISKILNCSQVKVQFAFSLGIFFLGMGAAFFGKIVEKNIRVSTIIGAILFIGGLVMTSIGIQLKSLVTIFLGYGVMLGLGTGITYISPVKTMMLWFPKYKAVASAIPIIFFGLGSTFSTFIHSGFNKYGIKEEFFIFSVIYALLMAVGILLLKKPEGIEENLVTDNKEFKYKELLKDSFFIHAWVFMFLNISAGLCLIPLAKQMMLSPKVRYSSGIVTIIIALAGIFNGGGRFVFAYISDIMKNRINIIAIILGISASMMYISLFPKTIGISLLVINACYGAGFSVIPAILSSHFGMENISKIHGAVLSAWGIAGLVGNQLAIFISDTCNFGYFGVIILLIWIYVLNIINFLGIREVKESICHSLRP